MTIKALCVHLDPPFAPGPGRCAMSWALDEMQTAFSMFPRKGWPRWQQVAHQVDRPDSGFAIAQALGNSIRVADALRVCKDCGQDCYPFPSPWSGPAGVGPFFRKLLRAIGHSRAICVRGCFLWFDFAELAVESASITTNNRGRIKTCVKRSSFLRFLQLRWLAVCKTRPAVALPGRLPVPHLPILPTTTRLPARLLVVWRGQQPAASTSACRPAIDLTSARTAAIAAFRAAKTKARSSGDIPRLAAFAFSSPRRSYTDV